MGRLTVEIAFATPETRAQFLTKLHNGEPVSLGENDRFIAASKLGVITQAEIAEKLAATDADPAKLIKAIAATFHLENPTEEALSSALS